MALKKITGYNVWGRMVKDKGVRADRGEGNNLVTFFYVYGKIR